MSERRPLKPTTRGVPKHDDADLTAPERPALRKPPTKPPPIPAKALEQKSGKPGDHVRTLVDPKGGANKPGDHVRTLVDPKGGTNKPGDHVRTLVDPKAAGDNMRTLVDPKAAGDNMRTLVDPKANKPGDHARTLVDPKAANKPGDQTRTLVDPKPADSARTIVDPQKAPERPMFVATSAKTPEGAKAAAAALSAPAPGSKDAKDASSSQPLQVISMKTPAELAAEKPAAKLQPDQRRMKLHDVRPRNATPPQGLGHLAPPRDERDARLRRRQDLLIWGSVIVIVGSLVTLGIWFLAR